MNNAATQKLEEAIESLPKGITCFLLEIDTELPLTRAIGEMLKEKRPLCILMSIKDYGSNADKINFNNELVKYSWKLDDNIMLMNTTTEYFLKENQTRFNVIFSPNGVDAIPMKKFLKDKGQVVVIGAIGW